MNTKTTFCFKTSFYCFRFFCFYPSHLLNVLFCKVRHDIWVSTNWLNITFANVLSFLSWNWTCSSKQVSSRKTWRLSLNLKVISLLRKRVIFVVNYISVVIFSALRRVSLTAARCQATSAAANLTPGGNPKITTHHSIYPREKVTPWSLVYFWDSRAKYCFKFHLS